MIDHVNLPITNLDTGRAFYERILQPLGYRFILRDGDAVGFGVNSWAFGLVLTTSLFPPIHVAFAARRRGDVDRFYETAMAAGARSNGAPGLRPQYHANYYAAYVLDPDGHTLDAVCRTAVP